MPNYLEIDSKILERNLLLKNDSTDADDLEKFFRSPEDYMKENAAWKLVTPTAGHVDFLLRINEEYTLNYIIKTSSWDEEGFCVKTTDSKNKKVFINICKLDDIPEPKDVTEAELLELWQSEDVPDYRIPLSIQEPHDEFDKSGNPTVAYDVAVNAKFFQKIQSSAVFQCFVMQVVMEGIENKYGIEIKKEGYVVLRNKKCLGELKPHRIRKSKLPGARSKPLIEELNSRTITCDSAGDSAVSQKVPQFRLFENTRNGFAVGEFHLPHLVTHKDLTLHANDDRLVLDSRRGAYFSDFFFPLKVNEAEMEASYNSATCILTVKMPITSAP